MMRRGDVTRVKVVRGGEGGWGTKDSRSRGGAMMGETRECRSGIHEARKTRIGGGQRLLRSSQLQGTSVPEPLLLLLPLPRVEPRGRRRKRRGQTCNC